MALKRTPNQPDGPSDGQDGSWQTYARPIKTHRTGKALSALLVMFIWLIPNLPVVARNPSTGTCAPHIFTAKLVLSKLVASPGPEIGSRSCTGGKMFSKTRPIKTPTPGSPNPTGTHVGRLEEVDEVKNRGGKRKREERERSRPRGTILGVCVLPGVAKPEKNHCGDQPKAKRSEGTCRCAGSCGSRRSVDAARRKRIKGHISHPGGEEQ